MAYPARSRSTIPLPLSMQSVLTLRLGESSRTLTTGRSPPRRRACSSTGDTMPFRAFARSSARSRPSKGSSGLPKSPHKLSKRGDKSWEHIKGANEQANPELLRLALKLATGAGKTTVMAMLIAWQTVNAVRHPNSQRFTRGFLVVAPGLTIKDRLRVLKPNDPDSYYQSRELVPPDLLGDLG